MLNIPRLAQSEWKIMKVLWASSGPMPAYDIIQELSQTTTWRPKTVKTLLNRLIKKGALGYKTYKNFYLYYPLVSEEACIRMESESFIDRCFDGSLQPMLAHFVKTKRLTASEVKELKRILEKKEVTK